ncbi:hypothetical protein XPA_008068 [Xanthoria parietina]
MPRLPILTSPGLHVDVSRAQTNVSNRILQVHTEQYDAAANNAFVLHAAGPLAAIKVNGAVNWPRFIHFLKTVNFDEENDRAYSLHGPGR